MSVAAHTPAARIRLTHEKHRRMGYYWSPAVPPGDLAQWAHQHKARIGPAIESSIPGRANEVDRLDALHNYAVLDTAYQAIFNDIAAAARIG